MDEFVIMMVKISVQCLQLFATACMQLIKAIQHARKQARKQHAISDAAIRIVALEKVQRQAEAQQPAPAVEKRIAFDHLSDLK